MNERELRKIIRDCLRADYGIEGKLSRLPGENLNFAVLGPGRSKHVFKIVDSQMPADAVAMQYAVIEHAVSAGFGPQLPRIRENLYGNIETRIKMPIKGVFRAILMEFIDGTEMCSISDISEKLIRNLGETLGSFNRALRDFDHPAAHRAHRWNLAAAGQHEGKIALIEEEGKRDLLAWAFATWRLGENGLHRLPWQVIHGDAHDENVLVGGERVTGLIDFGDCCYNPTICDLAICITYLMMRDADFLRVAALLADGYQAERRLTAAELEAIFPLVCGRLAVSICVANERKRIDPDNPNWFGGEGAAWRLLQALRDLGEARFLRAISGPRRRA